MCSSDLVLFNAILICQGRFFAKVLLGFCYICSWAGLVRTDSMSARAGGMASDAVKRFNNMYSTYNTLNNINNALLNQDFLKGLYEAVKSIPYLNKYISGIETLFSIVQSQEFNASLMDKVENDRTVLGRYNQNDPNVQRERNDLLKVKKFAKENLDAIKQQNIDSIHERICTCPK